MASELAQEVAIVQSDRDAAAWSAEQAGFTAEAEAIKSGDRDHLRRVRSFARYRNQLCGLCGGTGEVGGEYGLTPSHCECRYEATPASPLPPAEGDGE